MAGATGSGKSTTINVLFDDEHLCPTNSSTSETREPVLLKKELKVTKESPSIISSLGIVDVPGVFDTNKTREDSNLESIKAFRAGMPEFESRETLRSLVRQDYFNIRETVYPNLVLFTVQASDNRMCGPDSFLRNSLKAFKELGGLIDHKCPNLIIVLTHAMCMGQESDAFQQDLHEKVINIRKVVYEVVGIPWVEVVPVENLSKKYLKNMIGDFYQLPNGELSHKNLFDAMNRLFVRNNDLLGQLLSSWYFSPECPDRANTTRVVTLEEIRAANPNPNGGSLKANQSKILQGNPNWKAVTIPPTVNPLSLTASRNKVKVSKEASKQPSRGSATSRSTLKSDMFLSWSSVVEGQSEDNHDAIPSKRSSEAGTESLSENIKEFQHQLGMELPQFPNFNFQSLGHGYCPVLEEIRPVSLLQRKSGGSGVKPIRIHNSNFLVPQCVSAYVKSTSRFHTTSFPGKSDYENHMKGLYGLDANMKLVVSTEKNGRWNNRNPEPGSNRPPVLTMMHEIKVATFKLENPKLDLLSDEFRRELNFLPAKYTERTAAAYQAFFSKWGTHVIIEASVGGAITVDLTLKETSTTANKCADFERMLSPCFQGESFQHSGSEDIIYQLGEAGVRNNEVRIVGGVPPLPELVSLEALSPSVLKEWAASIPQNPAHISRTIKLYPYYNFFEDGSVRRSLRHATQKYLEGNPDQVGTLRRNWFTFRKNMADAGVDNAARTEPKENCFPEGTMVYVGDDGQAKAIENLKITDPVLTRSIQRGGAMMKLGGEKTTSFCIYLDRKDGVEVEYLVLAFSNMKTLVVSPGHLIFEYRPGSPGLVLCKQAKHFKIGESAVYWQSGRVVTFSETPRVQAISTEKRKGAYSPLTRSGTFFADGFLVTCYAHTDHFRLAQMATLPLKIWSKLISSKIANKDEEEDHNNGLELQGIHPYAKALVLMRTPFSILKKYSSK